MNRSNDRPKIKRTSISAALNLVFAVIILVVIISFVISVNFVIKSERRAYAVREAQMALTTLSNSLSSNISNYSELSRLIMIDDSLVTFLRADASTVDFGVINDARYGIMNILNVKEGVDCVLVFRNDMIMLATDRAAYSYESASMQTDLWKESIYEGKGRAVVGLNSYGVASRKDGLPVITIGRAIYDMYTQKRTGILLMNISSDVLSRILRQGSYHDVCLVGTNGEYLAGNKEYMKYYSADYAGNEILNRNVLTPGGNKLVSGCLVEGLPIVMLYVSAYGSESIPYGIIQVLIILMLVFMAVAGFAGAYVSRNITMPIMQLSGSMDKNKKSGELKKLDVEMPYSELNLLKGDYNDMIDHVNELIDTLVDKEKILRRAELRVLQEQIKPHFLYNSLETIGFLAFDAGADNVHEALETLGSFYRNFLSKGNRVITFGREVQIVRDYLSLQKLRYGDIIEDVYDIAPETEDFNVPKLILQPLVENSIYHGIRLKGEKGTIKIVSRLDDDILYVIVEDTGVGMSKEQIQKILSKDRNDRDEEKDSSFGLWGTIERIRMYCNDDDVVKISSEVGEYTSISFAIRSVPAVSGVEEDEEIV